MEHLRHAFRTRPHFVSYWVNELPAVAPWIARNIFGLPLLTGRCARRNSASGRHAMPTRSPSKGFGRKTDPGSALLKSLAQCTIFASGHHVRWLIVTRDRFKIVDGVIRNNPRSRVVRQPDSGCGLGCLRQSAADPDGLDGLDTLASRGPAGNSCIDQHSPITHLFHTHFSPLLEASGSACARTGWGPRHCWQSSTAPSPASCPAI